MKQTLWELTERHSEALEDVLAAEEAILQATTLEEIEAADAALKDAQQELNWALETLGNKIENYIKFVENLNHLTAGLDDVIKEIQGRKRAAQNLATRLKKRLLEHMQQNDLEKTNAGIFTVRQQLGSHAVETLIPAEELPEEYQRVKVEPNRNAIREALKRGEEIRGTKLIRRPGLRWRVRSR